jgi:hypothetical protein
MNTRDIMLDIAREAILNRAARDGYFPDDYDPVKDDEGYVISLIVALRHWSNAHSMDWRADLERAENLFREDMTESLTAS